MEGEGETREREPITSWTFCKARAIFNVLLAIIEQIQTKPETKSVYPMTL